MLMLLLVAAATQTFTWPQPGLGEENPTEATWQMCRELLPDDAESALECMAVEARSMVFVFRARQRIAPDGQLAVEQCLDRSRLLGRIGWSRAKTCIQRRFPATIPPWERDPA